MANGFLQGVDGGNSNSRLIADVIIVCALLMCFIFIAIGVFAPTISLMNIATAIGVLFGAVAGTAMTFLFFQKKNEVDSTKNNL